MSLVRHGAVQDFQTYYELVVPWTDGNGTVAYLTNAEGWRFCPNDLLGNTDEGEVAAPDQYAKLQYYFNMYEKFKLSKVAVRYVPRWSQVKPFYAGSATTTTSPCPATLCSIGYESCGMYACFHKNETGLSTPQDGGCAEYIAPVACTYTSITEGGICNTNSCSGATFTAPLAIRYSQLDPALLCVSFL